MKRRRLKDCTSGDGPVLRSSPMYRALEFIAEAVAATALEAEGSQPVGGEKPAFPTPRSSRLNSAIPPTAIAPQRQRG